MKKVLVTLLALAVFAASFAGSILTAGAAEEVKDLDSYAPQNASFDTIYWNGTYGSDAQIGADGGAADWLTANGGAEHHFDNSDASLTTVGLRGWVGFDQPIVAFGYQVNDGNVYFGNYAEATGDDVRNAGGENAQRYNVNIHVLAFSGETKFTAAAKLADGTVVKLTSSATPAWDATVALANPECEVVTGVEAVDFSGAMSYDFNYWNGAQLNPGYGGPGPDDPGLPANNVKQYLEEDGTLDTAKYSGLTYGMYGWVAVNNTIEKIGYVIDGVAHFDGYCAVSNAETGVVDAAKANGIREEFLGEGTPGAKRFTVTVPLNLVSGTQNVGIILKLADGTMMNLNSPGMNNTFLAISNFEDLVPGDTQPATDELPIVTDEPVTDEPAPQTGDAAVAMFAVVLVAAMGAAVVFAKKRAF